MELGAAPTEEDGLTIVINTDEAYTGKLEFDIPRHRLYMGFQKDWPRMNTLPEWFTVEPEEEYVVLDLATKDKRVYTGRQLHHGLSVDIAGGASLRLKVVRTNLPRQRRN